MKIFRKPLVLFVALIAAVVVLTGCGGAAPPTGWSRPVGVQDTVYVASTGGKVYSLDAATGAKKWTFPADNNHIAASGSSLYADPVVADKYVFVAASDKKLYVLNAATGDKVCDFETGDAIIGTPGYGNGLVYVGSSDIGLVPLDVLKNGDFGHLAEALRPAPAKLFAVDPSQRNDKLQCAEKWSFATQNKIWAEPLLAGDRLYVASLDRKLYALNAGTGQKVWEFEAEGAIASSPKSANGLIYFGSFDTKVYAIRAATGEKVWEFSTGNWVWADPLVVTTCWSSDRWTITSTRSMPRPARRNGRSRQATRCVRLPQAPQASSTLARVMARSTRSM